MVLWAINLGIRFGIRIGLYIQTAMLLEDASPASRVSCIALKTPMSALVLAAGCSG